MNFRVEHSELYSLEPIGLDGPYRESLTSYITRLSTAHCLPNKDFILYLASRSKPLGNIKAAQSFFADYSRTINGYTHFAKEFSEIITELTLVNSILRTTMLPFIKLFDSGGKGLLKGTKAWCSYCYSEQAESGNEIHDQLIWSINNAEICPIHRAQLSSKCPHCKAQQPHLPTFTPLGQCVSCGSNLASKSDGQLTQLLNKQHCDHTDCILQLLSISYNEMKCVSHERTIKNIHYIINETTKGNAKKLNTALGFGESTLAQWRRGRSLPKFDQLISFLFKTGVDVKDFFIGEVSKVALNIDRLDQKIPRPKRTRHDHKSIEKKITEILASPGKPLSFKAATKMLEVSEGYLRYRFPKESEQIIARHKNYMDNVHITQEEKTKRKVTKTIKDLHDEGIYPSQVRVFRPEFGLSRSELMKPSIYDTWRDTLTELGYQL